MIKWISKATTPKGVQQILNEYAEYVVPESVRVTMTDGLGLRVLLVFMLNQTFNYQEELNEALRKESK